MTILTNTLNLNQKNPFEKTTGSPCITAGAWKQLPAKKLAFLFSSRRKFILPVQFFYTKDLHITQMLFIHLIYENYS
jgi:hypothetical protein